MSELVILRAGDIRISWNSENVREVEVAEKTFNERIKEGWSAFKETIRGEKGERIRTFDPDAERIVLVPQIVGGK